MFFVYIKGRGYYNGTKEIRKWQQGNINITLKPIFKRSNDFLKSTYAFKTKEEAQGCIDGLVEESNNEQTITETIERWGRTYSTTRVYERSALTKCIDKLEVKSGEDYTIQKRTYRNIGQRKTSVGIAKGDAQACNYCRISFIDNEPFAWINDTRMCINCSEKIFDKLKSDFEAQGNSQELRDAWEIEMVSREL